jgi:hypothetical protein
MDLGLGNLDDVKQFVLPPAIIGDTQYDKVLSVIAGGIAQAFETYCNRKFSRVVNDQVTFDAMRKFYLTPRFPFEAYSMVELRSTNTDAWEDITTAVVQDDPSIGWIYFGCFVGDPICLVRLTYTGGFFYETQEPLLADGTANPAYPTAVPAGSYPVPPSLKNAWLLQCLHEFELKDRLLPSGLVGEGQKSRLNWRLDQLVLLPEVQNRIQQFIRYAIV